MCKAGKKGDEGERGGKREEEGEEGKKGGHREEGERGGGGGECVWWLSPLPVPHLFPLPAAPQLQGSLQGRQGCLHLPAPTSLPTSWSLSCDPLTAGVAMRGPRALLPHSPAPTFLPSLVPLPFNVLTAGVAVRVTRPLLSLKT